MGYKLLRLECECGKVFHVPEYRTGQKGRCLKCKKILTVPTVYKEPEEVEEVGDIIFEEEGEKKEIPSEISSEKGFPYIFLLLECIGTLILGIFLGILSGPTYYEIISPDFFPKKWVITLKNILPLPLEKVIKHQKVNYAGINNKKNNEKNNKKEIKNNKKEKNIQKNQKSTQNKGDKENKVKKIKKQKGKKRLKSPKWYKKFIKYSKIIEKSIKIGKFDKNAQKRLIYLKKAIKEVKKYKVYRKKILKRIGILGKTKILKNIKNIKYNKENKQGIIYLKKFLKTYNIYIRKKYILKLVKNVKEMEKGIKNGKILSFKDMYKVYKSLKIIYARIKYKKEKILEILDKIK